MSTPYSLPVMKSNKEIINIVVPVYKTELTPYEKLSLDRLVQVLGNYPKTIIHPRGLNLAPVTDRYPGAFTTQAFAADYFDGIDGYNRLMLSPEFYEAFLSFDHILIYQLDAYVFRDELTAWCAHGYDYIGAPWLCKTKYNRFPLNIFLKTRGLAYHLFHIKHRQQCFYRVGNGGLSLRVPASCLRILREQQSTVKHYLKNLQKSSQYNEDVFWALEAARQPYFRIPGWQEALRFSFDLFPELCYHYSQHHLPFGCHRWHKELQFWQDHIPLPK